MVSTETTPRERVASRWRDPFTPEPWARRLVLMAPDVKRDEAVLARLRRALYEGDPLADAVAAYLMTGTPDAAKSRRALFERGVEHGLAAIPDAPPTLAAFFGAVDTVPAWLDHERIARAKRLGQRVAFGGDYVLSCFALMPGYLAIGTAKVLARTGALERMAYRRLAETSKFVADVYAPAALDRNSHAVKSAIRVRVMHALVRRQTLNEGWDEQAYGIPVNQLDQCGTNLLFGVMYTMGLRTLGFVVSRQEREDVVHLWRYIGWLLGVADDLVPATERDGRRLLRLIGAAQQGPDDDTRRLASSLLSAVAQRWEGKRFGKLLARLDVGFRAGLTRVAIGGRGGDLLGLPNDAWQLAILGVFPVVRALEVARQLIPGGTRWMERFGERVVRNTIDAALGHARPAYVPYPRNETRARATH